MPNLPDFESLLEKNPGWLDSAIPPREAARIVGRTEKALGILRVRGWSRDSQTFSAA